VRPVRCVRIHGADVVKVSNSECPTDTAPNTVDKCNLQHCPARYDAHTGMTIITFMGQIFESKEIHSCAFPDGERRSQASVRQCAAREKLNAACHVSGQKMVEMLKWINEFVLCRSNRLIRCPVWWMCVPSDGNRRER